ncbi:hypothetical protein E1B28_010342 [Marasmius oreades]|uniref:rRNA-processing protein EFG1 n=1 Tax=Marasmius oreades TaxID=181124 RepID=A0A9P7RY44_9AGAR|nr:uncharacterized protein E1B28_010342 [Marasmius oreades]KAG7091296.1 hypothetical protein E1B28_010342 [Marasmius oreades]
MGPVRTEKHSQHPSSSTKGKTNSNRTNSDPNVLPGVQKIKAAMRQARRLLAKDKLDADVRVHTERKLKSLELDLAKAEESRRERTFATKYHKIKFFERQKVSRKIKQAKRKLAEDEDSSKQRLQSELFDLRVDLNYILHYPKTKKYISLFPPEVRKGQEKPADDSAATNAERGEVRNWIREQMEKGALPGEPESTLQQENGITKKRVALKPHVKWDKHEVEQADESDSYARGEEKDDFFGDDDDEDEDS